MKENILRLFYSILLFLGFSLSTYLLFHHLDALYLNGDLPDICSMAFGRSCEAALASPLSEVLGLPLPGWGLVFYVLLGSLFILRWYWEDLFRDSAAIASWFVILAGVGASSVLLAVFIMNPSWFCPLCALIHGINLMLVYPGWSLFGRQGGKARSLKKAGRFLLSPKEESAPGARLQLLGFLLVLFVALAFFQWARLQESAYREAAAVAYQPDMALRDFFKEEVAYPTGDSAGHRVGPLDAPLQLVIFSDFQCPACASFNGTLTYFKNLYGNQMSVVFRHFPLSSRCNSDILSDFHPQACKAAQAAEAAALQGKFGPYHDALFRATLEDSIYFTLAREAALDAERFRQDFSSREVEERVAADIALGQQLGLQGTPALFLNGRRVKGLSRKNLSLLFTFEFLRSADPYEK